MAEKDKKNKENLRNQILIIDKRQDVKGKKLLSKNEEDKIKAVSDFFKKEIEVYNMFLGENGVEKVTTVIMTSLSILMLVLVVRAVTLPGASKGLLFYLKPDFSKMINN